MLKQNSELLVLIFLNKWGMFIRKKLEEANN